LIAVTEWGHFKLNTGLGVKWSNWVLVLMVLNWTLVNAQLGSRHGSRAWYMWCAYYGCECLGTVNFWLFALYIFLHLIWSHKVWYSGTFYLVKTAVNLYINFIEGVSSWATSVKRWLEKHVVTTSSNVMTEPCTCVWYWGFTVCYQQSWTKFRCSGLAQEYNRKVIESCSQGGRSFNKVLARVTKWIAKVYIVKDMSQERK
jgi:hypothetical protein